MSFEFKRNNKPYVLQVIKQFVLKTFIIQTHYQASKIRAGLSTECDSCLKLP